MCSSVAPRSCCRSLCTPVEGNFSMPRKQAGHAALLLLPLLAAVSCAGEESEAGPGEGSGQAQSEPESTGVEDPELEGPVDYTVPAEADDYCGVLEGLVQLNDEASMQSQDASLDQLGERLELFVGAAAELSELAPDEESEEQWGAVEEAYGELHDFYLSSGGQVENEQFIVLLAEATQVSAEAYESQQEGVQEECDVDLSLLMQEG